MLPKHTNIYKKKYMYIYMFVVSLGKNKLRIFTLASDFP